VHVKKSARLIGGLVDWWMLAPGFDCFLGRAANLALSVKERREQHDGALELALKLQAAGKLKDARLQSSASSTL